MHCHFHYLSKIVFIFCVILQLLSRKLNLWDTFGTELTFESDYFIFIVYNGFKYAVSHTHPLCEHREKPQSLGFLLLSFPDPSVHHPALLLLFVRTTHCASLPSAKNDQRIPRRKTLEPSRARRDHPRLCGLSQSRWEEIQRRQQQQHRRPGLPRAQHPDAHL